MGLIIDRGRAFHVCHGYKIDDELILWSSGVVGALSDEQEHLCNYILIENAKGGPKKYNSVEEALRAKTISVPKNHLHQLTSIRQCASILDRAEDIGLISGLNDVYGLMDYCMEKLGHPGEKKRYVREDIKEFVDRHL